jgi:hypothetical protein
VEAFQVWTEHSSSRPRPPTFGPGSMDPVMEARSGAELTSSGGEVGIEAGEG